MGRNKKRVAAKKNIEETTVPSLRDQFKKRRGTIILCLLAGALWVVAVYLLHYFTNIRITYLTRDVIGVMRAIPLIGLFSTIGILILAATAGVTWFGYMLIRDKGDRGAQGFLLYSALICTLITLDDALVLHDHILTGYFHIKELWTYSAYAIVALFYIGKYRSYILKTDYLLFILACFFLGTSVAIDQLFHHSEMQTFIEDSFKFFGIFFWMAYFTTMVRQKLREVSER